jgi:branched-chain amino acid transport system ATP-binding protein
MAGDTRFVAPSGGRYEIGWTSRLLGPRSGTHAFIRPTSLARPMTKSGEPLLKICGLSKTFGTLQALAAVDLIVPEGTLHGLIGPNGSGKSTLLKAVAGACPIDSGTIIFMERDITATPAYKRARAGISLKFQIPAVLPLLAAYDNILLVLQARETPWSLMRSTTCKLMHENVMASLERFSLAGRADDPAGELSHGEQQWLEIAMALAAKPSLLLLDEPTAGMSPEERRVTGKLLETMKSECTLMIVEHDLDFVREICDQLTVLDQGRVLGTGTTEEIKQLPKVREVYTTRV